MNSDSPVWRGLTPLVMDPGFGEAPNQEKMEPARIMDGVRWTHYDDLRNVYGPAQYGLCTLLDGNISTSDFLKLNALIGGWKQPSEIVLEGFPFVGEFTGLGDFDHWSFGNMPVIDRRHYLEEVLDMHNSQQSFSARQRIVNKMVHSGNQVIWFTDARPTDTLDEGAPCAHPVQALTSVTDEPILAAFSSARPPNRR